jgi:hypothetical protein
LNRPSTRALFVFLTDDGFKKTSQVLGAAANRYARPIKIVMRPTFYFDFHVSDAYVFEQLTHVVKRPVGVCFGSIPLKKSVVATHDIR